MTAADSVSLALIDRRGTRRIVATVTLGIIVVAAAIGGVLGLIFGRTTGLVAAAVVGLPLLVAPLSELRSSMRLDGAVVVARRWSTRKVDLRSATRLDLVITDVRGRRTLSLFVANAKSRRSIPIALAKYTANAGAELGIVALRALANALARAEHSSGLVLSELLVAQLRAEARGEPLAGRPLFALADAAVQGRIATRVPTESLVTFVAALD